MLLSGNLESLVVATRKTIVLIERNEAYVHTRVMVYPMLETSYGVVGRAIVNDIGHKLALSLRE